MVGLGPRVGGAHVDVNLKFDDKSVDAVGKRIHRQLSNLTKDLAKVGERNREVYRSIGRDAVTAWRALLGSVVAGAPLMGSAISGVAGAATLLAGALYSTAQAGYAVAPLLSSIGVAAGTALLGIRPFFKALKDGDLTGLPPQAKAAAKAVQGLGDAWQKVSTTVQNRMFKGLADDIAKLGNTLLPVLQRGLGKMGDSLNFLAQEILDYVNSAAGLKVINRFLTNMADIFRRLAAGVVPFLDGFLRLMNALSPAAKRLADRITDVATRFQSWTKGEGFGKRIDDMMKGAEKTAGLLLKVLGNLGAAIRNIFNTANPATNTFLQMLVDVTQRFEDWTNSVGGQNSIAQWAEQSVDVMRQFGKTAEAVFKVIAELADPRVIISFLKTLQGAFEYLGQLPLDKIVNAFVTLSETLQPVSSLFLAIVIAGAAMNIMLGSLIGQVGGLFSVLLKILKFRVLINLLKGVGGSAEGAGAAAAGAAGKTGLLARAWGVLVKILSKVKSLFSGVIGFFTKTSSATASTASGASRLAGAFKPVLAILGRFVKFVGPVGIAIWIGTLIAKSKDLQSKFGDIWGALKELGSSLAGAFKEIGEALKPLAPAAKGAGNALGWIFKILDKLATLAIGVVLDMIVYGIKSIANVVKGAGKLIAGFINVLMGLFTLDFDKVLDGLKQMASGVVPLLKGLFGVFITFFAPARFAKLGLTALKGLGGGLVRATPGIFTFLKTFLGKVLAFLGTLPARLLALGVRAFTSLATAAKNALPKVLAFTGRIVLGVIKWLARLPGRLLNLAGRAFLNVLKAAGKAAPKIIKTVARLYADIIKWIAKLPGRLLKLSTDAFSKILTAATKAMPKILAAAGRIFAGIVKWIAKLPGKLLTLAQQAMNKVQTAIGNAVSKVSTAAGKIFDAVFNAVKELPGKMLTIGKEIVSSIAKGITDSIQKVKDAAGKVASAVKNMLPGSPVKDGPLRAWNYGNGATGGGRNVVDSIAKGLDDASPIRDAMRGVAGSIASAAIPSKAGASTTATQDPTVATTPQAPIEINQNYYGPTTSGGRLREIDWTLRYATKARRTTAEGFAS